MSFHPLSTETIKFWQATDRGASTGSHSTLTRPFFLVSDSLRGSVVGFGAPGGPRPPETPGQSQSRKRRHYSHPPVWPVRRGVRQRGRFRGPCFGGAGAGQVLSRQRRGRLNSRQAPRGGPCLRLRCCRRRRRRCRCSGCWGGRWEVELSPALGSPSVLLFLSEESSFLRRSLTPVVSRGNPCGPLGTQRRCLFLPPIPSIKMLVSPFAAPCPAWAGVQAHPARSLLRSCPPGRGWMLPFFWGSFLKSLEKVGGLAHQGTGLREPVKWALD